MTDSVLAMLFPRSSFVRNRRVFLLGLVVFPALYACSSGHDLVPYDDRFFDRDPVSTGGQGGEGAGPNLGGDGDGDGDDPGSGGRPPITMGGASTGSEVPEEREAQCDIEAEWQGAFSVGTINTAADERLMALSADGLSLAFTRDDGTLLVSDRLSRSASFDTELEVILPDEFDTSLGVALSPDGLVLTATLATGGGFAVFRRGERDETFSIEPDESEMRSINRVTMTTNLKMSYPVLAVQGTQFWYVAVGEYSSVWVSEQDEGYFFGGEQVGCNEFACDYVLFGDPESGKRITAVSEDALTVFFLDDEGKSKARWRKQPMIDSGFFEEIDLDQRFDVRVSTDCDGLYYTAEGDILFDEP